MSRTLGALLVLLAGVCWGTAGVLGKLVMNLGFSPLTVIAYRLSLGFLILMVVAIALKGTRVLSVSNRDLPLLVVAGVVGVSLGMLLYFWSVDLIGASLAVVLLYTAPIFTLILARPMLHEEMGGVKIASALLVFVGCYLAVKGYDLAYLKINCFGVIVGLLSGLSYSTYFVVSKKVMSRGVPVLTVLLYSIGFGALATLIATAVVGFHQSSFSAYSTFLIVLLAIIPTALANLLFVVGLNLTEAGKANVYSTVEVVTAIALAMTVLGEGLEALQALGCTIVVAGITLLYSSEALQRVKRGLFNK